MGSQRDGHFVGLMVTAMLAIAAVTKDHWIRGYYLWCIVLAVLLYSITVARQAVAPFIDMHLNNLDYMLKLSAGMIVYVLATKIKDIHKVLNVLCAFALFQCGIYLIQRLGWDLVKAFSVLMGGMMIPMAPAGTMGNPNFLAAVLALTAPLFLRGRWAYGLIVTIPVLWLQSTSGAVIAFLIAFGYVAIKTQKRALYAIVPLMAVSLWVFWTYFDIFEFDGFRHRTWMAVVMTWKNWWLIGNGPGSFQIFAKVEHAHNEFLETAFETGIIGLACIVGFGITLLKKSLKARGTEMLVCASLITLGVFSFFHYPLHLAPSGFIALVLMGVYTGGKLQSVL